FTDSVRTQILERLGAFASDLARAYRAEARLTLSDMRCAPVVNHDAQTTFVHDCATAELGSDAVGVGRPVMASDDMCYFLRERPGCYFRVGVAPTHGRPAPHHAPEFEMNEEGLPVGLRVALGVMLNALTAACPAPPWRPDDSTPRPGGRSRLVALLRFPTSGLKSSVRGSIVYFPSCLAPASVVLPAE